MQGNVKTNIPDSQKMLLLIRHSIKGAARSSRTDGTWVKALTIDFMLGQKIFIKRNTNNNKLGLNLLTAYNVLFLHLSIYYKKESDLSAVSYPVGGNLD